MLGIQTSASSSYRSPHSHSHSASSPSPSSSSRHSLQYYPLSPAFSTTSSTSASDFIPFSHKTHRSGCDACKLRAERIAEAKARVEDLKARRQREQREQQNGRSSSLPPWRPVGGGSSTFSEPVRSASPCPSVTSTASFSSRFDSIAPRIDTGLRDRSRRRSMLLRAETPTVSSGTRSSNLVDRPPWDSSFATERSRPAPRPVNRLFLEPSTTRSRSPEPSRSRTPSLRSPSSGSSRFAARRTSSMQTAVGQRPSSPVVRSPLPRASVNEPRILRGRSREEASAAPQSPAPAPTSDEELFQVVTANTEIHIVNNAPATLSVASEGPGDIEPASIFEVPAEQQTKTEEPATPPPEASEPETPHPDPPQLDSKADDIEALKAAFQSVDAITNGDQTPVNQVPENSMQSTDAVQGKDLCDAAYQPIDENHNDRTPTTDSGTKGTAPSSSALPHTPPSTPTPPHSTPPSPTPPLINLRPPRPKVDMSDLTALTNHISTTLATLESQHTTLTRSPTPSAKPLYIESAKSIISTARSISRSWRTPAQACADPILSARLLGSLDQVDALAGQMMVLTRMKERDEKDRDAGGQVLVCARNVVGCCLGALSELEAVGVRLR
ncbi:uncharacterized protein SPPG_08341 [Spizellomyces punctatus DAOM BR117]|uniref:Uncharacterized protein n=1 Tax=Spizellomyces punctatus (strain DAOM BR117) TaxID=645134 RepID=A0A0L0H5K8_SPIPD|nr:uncharacterized protein SPPG_08341 [Spizellomyces punctatus DAOM BR117]KNC96186.1 hypothetical protein SPPG_08341 [Spizellomyces punctatus DAOM BR117]|eukprot:XP_016604226.1 hypothetical protein SPPG_08341 [Spizellomyces punctatus DAOM BR117]